MALVLKYLTVYLISGLKFIFGPVLGVANGLPVVATVILTTLGMMTTIYLFTFWGDRLRRFFGRFRKDKRVFTKKNRRFVKIWKKFGLKGVCFLTPIILTPPVGGLLVNLLSSNKRLILKWMWISSFSCSIITTLIVKYAFWLIKDFVSF